MARYFAILFFLFAVTRVSAQSVSILEGTINLDTGTMYMFAHDDDAYFPSGLTCKTAKVEKGKVTFTNHIDYPCQVIIGFKTSGRWQYLTHYFYIEPGTQFIPCDIHADREMPHVDNKAMKEYTGPYTHSFAAVEAHRAVFSKRYDSLHKVYNKAMPKDINAGLYREFDKIYRQTDSVLMSYVKEHNSSYVALWGLINDLQARYRPVYDTIFSLFSDEVKNSHTGKALAKKMASADHLNIGNGFPVMQLRDTADALVSVPAKNSGAEYTLVDFWFTHCEPCKEQLPGFKKLYHTYHKKGLEIIGISTDQKQYVADWKKMITDKDLNWPQYIDVDGTRSHGMGINAFPRNYLLDKDGRIIKINISTDELEHFLSDK